MSEENVIVVKQALDAWSRRDADAVRALVTPDVEIHGALSAVESRVFRGREALEEFFAIADSVFDLLGVEVESIQELDEKRVLVLGRIQGRGRGSGLDLAGQWGSLWELKSGQICRLQTFFDHAQARTAAGLSE